MMKRYLGWLLVALVFGSGMLPGNPAGAQAPDRPIVYDKPAVALINRPWVVEILILKEMQITGMDLAYRYQGTPREVKTVMSRLPYNEKYWKYTATVPSFGSKVRELFYYFVMYNSEDIIGRIPNRGYYKVSYGYTLTPIPTLPPRVPPKVGEPAKPPTPTHTPTEAPSATPSPTLTPTEPPTSTMTPTPSPTATEPPTNTSTPTNTFPPTLPPTNTSSPVPSFTPTHSPTFTPPPSATPVATQAKATNTSTRTPTASPTQTRTPSPEPTNTLPPTHTPSPTLIPTGTVPPAFTPTLTPTKTPPPTPLPTQVPPTATPEPTAARTEAPKPPTGTPVPTEAPAQAPTSGPTEVPRTEPPAVEATQPPPAAPQAAAKPVNILSVDPDSGKRVTNLHQAVELVVHADNGINGAFVSLTLSKVGPKGNERVEGKLFVKNLDPESFTKYQIRYAPKALERKTTYHVDFRAYDLDSNPITYSYDFVTF